MEVVRRGDHAAGQFRGEEEEVGAVTGDHGALPGVIDEHPHCTGGVVVALHEVPLHPFGVEVLLGKESESVAADLADEVTRQSAAGRPHRHVGGAAPGHEQHLTKGVAAFEQLGIGADQYVPGEVADHAQFGGHGGTVDEQRL